MTQQVSIVGAGVGGLMLARILHRHGIEAVLYEAEPFEAASSQGGQLDIHPHNGQIALAAAGLTEAFLSIIHQGGAATRVVAHDGTVLFEAPDRGLGDRPEVLRGDLRRILLGSIPEGTVRWGRKLDAALPLGDGRYELRFADGSAAQSTLLVGADGAWSKVRPLVTEAKPSYVGASFVETYLHDVDRRHAAIARLVGRGSLFAAAPGKGITAHREAGSVIHAYIQLLRPADWIDAIDFADEAAARSRLAGEFEGWAPELVAMIAAADTPPVPRKLHALPAGLRWAPVPGVTLIGDAGHLMPPAGEGANLAMLDAAELGAAIAAHPGDAATALRVHEERMFARSEAEAGDAMQILDLCLGAQAPEGLVDFLRG